MNIVKRKYKIPLYLILLHIVLGLLVFANSTLANIWCVSVIVLGLFYIIKNKNKNDEAAVWSAYIAGLGVLFKICKLRFGYDIDKYVIILFLLLGILYDKNQKHNNIWMVAVFLLLPSLMVPNVFNISFLEQFQLHRFALMGIITLLVSAFYFDGKVISKQLHLHILSRILLSLISTVVLVTIKAPSFSDVTFVSQSMEEMTGGFSPVHVSLVLGLGLLIVLLLSFLREGLIINIWGNYLLIAILILRILFGFSRSGLWSFIISLLLSLVFMRNIIIKRNKSFVFSLIILAIISIFVWNYVNQSTGGMAYNRYTGRNSVGEEMSAADVSSGRIEFVQQELAVFVKKPVLGIGPGNMGYYRQKEYGYYASSHTEYSRLISEHGMFGIIVIVILLVNTLKHFKKTTGLTRLFFIAFSSYALISMFPGATRTSLPLFIYGLSFVMIKKEKIIIKHLYYDE